jgi:hypothetical protein
VEPYTIIDDPSAWYADQYRDPESYTYRLSGAEIAELEEAILFAEGFEIAEEVMLLKNLRSRLPM